MPDTIPNFKDMDGRSWTLRLTVGLAKEIRDTCGFDIAKVLDGKAYFELANDDAKLAQILWILIESQAQHQNISPEVFARSLDGDALDDAVHALNACIVRFTRRSMRAALEKMIQTSMEAQAEGMETLTTWIEKTGKTELISKVKTATETAITSSISGNE